MGEHTRLMRRVWWREGRATIDYGDRRQSAHEYVSWQKEGDRWNFLWGLAGDRVSVCHFSSEKEVKAYVLRLAYNIADGCLIPSELLRDAGLCYLSVSLWVDSFRHQASGRVGEELIEWDGLTRPPEDRHLRLAGSDQPKERSSPRRFHQATTVSSTSTADDSYGQILEEVEAVLMTSPTGSNFSPVDPHWRDPALHARGWPARKVKQPPDEDCFFVFSPGDYENPQTLAEKAQKA